MSFSLHIGHHWRGASERARQTTLGICRVHGGTDSRFGSLLCGCSSRHWFHYWPPPSSRSRSYSSGAHVFIRLCSTLETAFLWTCGTSLLCRKWRQLASSGYWLSSPFCIAWRHCASLEDACMLIVLFSPEPFGSKMARQWFKHSVERTGASSPAHLQSARRRRLAPAADSHRHCGSWTVPLGLGVWPE
jgi:hypothetical protein